MHAPSIRWCRRRYGADPRLRFETAAGRLRIRVVARTGSADAYRFPVEDAGASLILAKSLFTHLRRADAAHYLREMRRALSPGHAAS